MQGSMSIERMCQLAEVSRAGFYRSLRERTPVEEDMELRSAIQQIALEHRRRYGYRRISAELRRRGMLATHFQSDMTTFHVELEVRVPASLSVFDRIRVRVPNE